MADPKLTPVPVPDSPSGPKPAEHSTPIDPVPTTSTAGSDTQQARRNVLASLQVGMTIAERYLLLSRIAIGGMGEVWKVLDQKTNQTRALKILRPELAGQRLFLSRLKFEAHNASQVHHPNLAAVLDSGEENGLGWLTMELVDGVCLTEILEQQPTLDPAFLLSVMDQTTQALVAVHHAGIVHRDIKPGNIMLTIAGEVKLTDFGISKGNNQLTLTAAGMVMGTAQYLPPEQAIGKAASPAGDLYALGVIAYEALAGRRPFNGAKPIDIAFAHVNQPVPPLPASVFPPLATLVMQLLEKDPAKRPESASVLLHQIRQIRTQLEAATTFSIADQETTTAQPAARTEAATEAGKAPLTPKVCLPTSSSAPSQGEGPQGIEKDFREQEANQPDSHSARASIPAELEQNAIQPSVETGVDPDIVTPASADQASQIKGENQASSDNWQGTDPGTESVDSANRQTAPAPTDLAAETYNLAPGQESSAALSVQNQNAPVSAPSAPSGAVANSEEAAAFSHPVSPALGETPQTSSNPKDTALSPVPLSQAAPPPPEPQWQGPREADGTPLRYLSGGTVPAPEIMPRTYPMSADLLAARRLERQSEKDFAALIPPVSAARSTTQRKKAKEHRRRLELRPRHRTAAALNSASETLSAQLKRANRNSPSWITLTPQLEAKTDGKKLVKNWHLHAPVPASDSSSLSEDTAASATARPAQKASLPLQRTSALPWEVSTPTPRSNWWTTNLNPGRYASGKQEPPSGVWLITAAGALIVLMGMVFGSMYACSVHPSSSSLPPTGQQNVVQISPVETNLVGKQVVTKEKVW